MNSSGVIVSRATKQLLVPHDKIHVLFPNAPTVEHKGTLYAVLPHTPRTQIQLRAVNIEVPAPILFHFDWNSADGQQPFEVQKNTAALATSYQRSFILNDMGCVDSDTEYLSPEGWRRIADYKEGMVAQYNPSTGSIAFVYPSKFVKLPCSEMIRFKTNRGVDQLLSPEHRVLLADGSVISAEEVEAIYLQGRQTNETRALRFRTTFNVLSTSGIKLTDVQIRVQVAVNADGYTATPSTNMVHINIKKERKIQRLRQLLASADIKYKEYAKTGKYEGYITFTFVAHWTKGFDKRWWNANQQQLCVVADELVHWDGSARKACGQEFFSTKKEDADFAQYAYAASGLRATVRLDARAKGDRSDCFRVYAANDKNTAGLLGQTSNGGRIANVWREPSTDGFKYCFMVPSTFLLLRRGGCIFATGNTGKTRASLWSWRYLHETGSVQKLLVIAPLSTLRFVWLREILMTMPEYKAVVLHGSKEKRLELLAGDYDIYVLNHDGLKTIALELSARTDIDCLIIDELAVYRNNSQRSKRMRTFAKRFTWVMGMTGRPMPNAPTDVWAQVQILTPQRVPKYFRHAQTQLMVQLNQFKWVPKENAVETALEWMQPSVRYALDDVTELPEAIYRTLQVDLSAEQKRVYTKLANEFAVMVKESVINAANAGVMFGKLLQVACGYIYTLNPEYVTLDSTPRQEMLLELVEEAPDKLIVFAPWRHLIDNLSALLTEKKIDHAVVHGEVTHREEIFNAFQNTTQYKVLLAHPQTVHHGLTLTAATTTVWYGPTTSLEVYQQACARIRRIGQKRKQLFLHLQGTAVEQKVYKMLQAKARVQDEFLEMLRAPPDNE